MARYLVESLHIDEECLRALEETPKQGDAALEKWEWGCMAGDHCGWAIVEATSESAA